jgi:hypothetical protein
MVTFSWQMREVVKSFCVAADENATRSGRDCRK